jgi:hypothetical protein
MPTGQKHQIFLMEVPNLVYGGGNQSIDDPLHGRHHFPVASTVGEESSEKECHKGVVFSKSQKLFTQTTAPILHTLHRQHSTIIHTT